MCTLCNPVNHVMLSELERMVVLAEAEAGLGDTAAHRPLSGPEKASGVRFSEIAALEEDYLATVAPILEAVHEESKAAILAALGAGELIDPRTLVAALENITQEQPATVAEMVAQATTTVSEALEDTYQGASETVTREAERQGVESRPRPLRADPGRFEAVARTVAAEPWKRLTGAFKDRVVTPANLATPTPRDQAAMALEDIEPKTAIDLARQANHGAINDARLATAKRYPLDYAYASELLDGKQCEPCEKIDGTEWETIEEAEAAYPGGGGYVRCDGGSRCRGTVVFVFDTTAEPLPDPEPEPQEPEDLRLIRADEEAPEVAARNANPRNEESREYQVNCSSVVVAYEARRRGYKVTAGPRTDGRTRKETMELWGSTQMYGMGSRKGLQQFNEMMPEGARGVMSGRWKGTTSGHIWNWEKIDGKIKFFEGQVQGVDANKYLSQISWGKKYPPAIMRVDDLDITNAIKEATVSEQLVSG